MAGVLGRGLRGDEVSRLFAKGSPYSWRALFAFVAVMATSTTLLAHGSLTGDQWVNVVQWVGGIFIGSEAARKFAAPQV